MKLSPDPKPFRLSLGEQGEILACEFLRKQGYKILEKNYQCALGEVDAIAKRKGRLAFIEIKTRSGERFGTPQEAVNVPKQKKLLRLAAWYLKERKIKEMPVSFDVVAVVWDKAQTPVIRLIQDAFGQIEEAC